MRRWVAGLVLALSMALTGCSATSALTGLVGSKPDLSVQAGAENTKQTVGLNNKVDTSTTTKTDFKDSTVGTVDTSSKKQMQSISTGTITAQELRVINNDSNSIIAAGFIGALIPMVLIILFVLIRKFRGKRESAE
ncbi:Rz-like spanin [Shigella phage Buco]|uniref:Putative spanin n=1 Tax=Shigella phage Buco TaxID=2530183 RepID=A0A482JKU5_9CAUD|nr:Rz-like spanin [Shigella phage Buco]QBP32949.1 putative spanin [Shigella phage Buco]